MAYGTVNVSGNSSDDIEKLKTSLNEINNAFGSTSDTGGSTSAGSIFAKLNKVISDIATHMGRWTSTRAGYIDTINTNASNARTYAQNSQNYTATNNTGSKTGILSQKLTYLISLLENGTYGLSVIKNQTNKLNKTAKSQIIKVGTGGTQTVNLPANSSLIGIVVSYRRDPSDYGYPSISSITADGAGISPINCYSFNGNSSGTYNYIFGGLQCSSKISIVCKVDSGSGSSSEQGTFCIMYNQ